MINPPKCRRTLLNDLFAIFTLVINWSAVFLLALSVHALFECLRTADSSCGAVQMGHFEKLTVISSSVLQKGSVNNDFAIRFAFLWTCGQLLCVELFFDRLDGLKNCGLFHTTNVVSVDGTQSTAWNKIVATSHYDCLHLQVGNSKNSRS